MRQRTNSDSTGALSILKESLVGKVLVKGDADYYVKIRRYWNQLLHQMRPLAFVEVHCENDVILALKHCVAHKLPLCVVSGACGDVSLANDTVIIDVSQLQEIKVDPLQKLLTTEPGVTIGQVDIHATKHNLAVPVGTASVVGLGGQALELGIGFLARRFGYLIDNICKYEMVLATGQKITVTHESDPDLFWALKGYGANFGIATKYTFKLHPMPSVVLGGSCYFSWENAKEVIKHAITFQNSFYIIREMTLFVMLHVTDYGFQVFYRFLFSGDLTEGAEIVNRLLSSCPAECLYNTIQQVPYDAFQRSCDNIYKRGILNYGHQGHFLTEVSDDYISTTVDAFSRLKPVENTYSNAYFEAVGGAISDVPQDASPFMFRKARFWVGIVGTAQSTSAYEQMSEVINQWNDKGSPYAMQVDPEVEKRVWNKLKAVKKRYDPDNVFKRTVCNIDPED